MMMKTVLLSCFGTFLLILMADGVLGDGCQTKMTSCSNSLSDKTRELAGVIQGAGGNATAITTLCGQLKQALDECQDELPQVCQSSDDINSVLQGLQNSYKRFCGPGSLCGAEISKCQAPFAEPGPSSREGEPDFEKMCRLQNIVKTCVETEIDAECLSSPEVQHFMNKVRNSMVSVLCDDQGGVNQCFARFWSCMMSGLSSGSVCSGLGTQLGCFSNLKEHCQISEESVTFKELRKVAIDTCQVLDDSSRDWGYCKALRSCLENSDIFLNTKRMLMTVPDAKTLEKMVDMALDSQTWCQFMSEISKCHVTTAPTCGFNDSMMASLKENEEEVNNTCFSSSPGSVHCLMWSNVVILVLVVLASWGNQ